MSRHSSQDYDWNQTDSNLPAHIRERLLYNQLFPQPSRWDRVKDGILTILLLIIFTSPVWYQFIGD